MTNKTKNKRLPEGYAYVCRGCGSKDIVEMAWIPVNAKAIGRESIEPILDSESVYCNDCCSHDRFYDIVSPDGELMSDAQEAWLWNSKEQYGGRVNEVLRQCD